mmetsp:Transcript_73216/g.118092  ORF Transcript_73216/g.118092 Transcript_73216/m.118092 type:complete len:202 (-) Transcript_73216:345-950(-)
MASFFKLPMAQVAARQQLFLASAEASVLPFVIIVLSVLLVAISCLRQKFELTSQPEVTKSTSRSAFAQLRHLLGSLTAAPSERLIIQETAANRQEECQRRQEQPAAEALDTVAIELPEPVKGSQLSVNGLLATESAWGNLQRQTYGRALILAHRELSLRIALGPPGLVQQDVQANQCKSALLAKTLVQGPIVKTKKMTAAR